MCRGVENVLFSQMRSQLWNKVVRVVYVCKLLKLFKGSPAVFLPQIQNIFLGSEKGPEVGLISGHSGLSPLLNKSTGVSC